MTDDVDDIDLEVPASLDGQRVDRVLAMLSGVPRSVAAALVATGAVRVGERVVTSRSTTLHTGDRLRALVHHPEAPLPVADASVTFSVVYEDADLIVVDKPAGLVVHHGAGRHGGTLVDGLLARFPDLAALPADVDSDPTRPGIVHRLDKGTSGLLVVARSPAAFDLLSRQLQEHTTERRYLALAAGTVADDRGVVDAPIGRSARRPDRMAVRASGRPARTRYVVQSRFQEPIAVTLLELALETGRTHQVRVHLAALHHPVIGDDRYGGAVARPRPLVAMLEPGRLCLHARLLSVQHPDGRHMTWESPLPSDLHAVLDSLS